MNRLLTAIFALTLLPLTVLGSTFEKGDRIHISNIHEIDDDLYAFGSNITIDGAVSGDVVLGGQQVTTNGKIGGSINVFAQTFAHTGATKLSLRSFAQECRISGYVGGSILAMGTQIRIDQSANVDREAHLIGEIVTVDGHIGQNLTVHADKIYISGQIDGDLELEGKHIEISAPAVINGNVTYRSKEEIDIEESGVTILGEVTQGEPEDNGADEEEVSDFDGIWAFSKMIAAFLFALLMIYMFRRYAQVSFEKLRYDFAKSIAVGILTLCVFFLSIVVLSLAMGGLILGLIISSGSTAVLGAITLMLSFLFVPISSFLSVSSAIVLYSGGILFAMLIGSLLFVRSRKDDNPLGRTKLLVGLFAATVIQLIPILGFIYWVVAILAGAGAIVLGVRNCRAEMKPDTAGDNTPAMPAPPPIEPSN